jgi:hypothetical protein
VPNCTHKAQNLRTSLSSAPEESPATSAYSADPAIGANLKLKLPRPKTGLPQEYKALSSHENCHVKTQTRKIKSRPTENMNTKTLAGSSNTSTIIRNKKSSKSIPKEVKLRNSLPLFKMSS